jgi:hypothetical protein
MNRMQVLDKYNVAVILSGAGRAFATCVVEGSAVALAFALALLCFTPAKL